LLAKGNEYATVPWVLGVAFAKRSFSLNSHPNRHAALDLGSASQLLSLKAHSLGLGMRFMAGFDAEKAKSFAPADFEPFTMFVLGHPEKGLNAPARNRKPLTECLFEDQWGHSL
jgi:nitroreductase